MASYTKIGPSLFDWPLFCSLSYPARHLWLALYASREAKRQLPGLFNGGVATIADSAKMGSIEVFECLAELQEKKVVNHDSSTKLTLFTSLPDRGERPSNGRCLKGWWRRWGDLPESSLKYRWVTLLQWLTVPMTSDHEKVWVNTFGTVDPESFADTVSETPPNIGSPDIRQLDLSIDTYDTHRERKREGERKRERKRSSGEAPGTPVGLREGSFTLADMLSVLETSGRVIVGTVDHRLGPDMWDTVTALQDQGMELVDVELGAAWLKAGGLHYRQDLGQRWIATPGSVVDVVNSARRWDAAGRPAIRPKKTGGATIIHEQPEYAGGEVKL